MPKEKTLNILVADDHALFRQTLAEFLKTDARVAQVGEASNGLEVLELVKKQKWDVILLDVEMPQMDGIAVLSHLEPICNTPVIIVSFSDSSINVLKAHQHGAKGYILKGCDTEELMLAISKVLKGLTYFTPTAQQSLISGMSTKLKSPFNFSGRELAVLKLVCQGKSSKEIGVELNVSKRTVDSHRVILLQKTNTPNTAGLVSFANKHGLI